MIFSFPEFPYILPPLPTFLPYKLSLYRVTVPLFFLFSLLPLSPLVRSEQ